MLYLDASGLLELRSENVIKMLKTSEKFFKLFLDYELDELVDEFVGLYTNSTRSDNLYKNSSFLSHTKVSHEFFWSLFSHCVHQDILNNKLNEKALKLLDSYNQVMRKLENEITEIGAH